MFGRCHERIFLVLSGTGTCDSEGCFDVQVRASGWGNGWEQEEAGIGENQHWAAEETPGPWHWHHLLHWLVALHIWEDCDKCNAQYLSYCTVLLFPSCPLSPGPEFGTEEDCIFVGMVTEDVDVSELVDTIAAFGRDIEESGRVTAIFILKDTGRLLDSHGKSFQRWKEKVSFSQQLLIQLWQWLTLWVSV